MMVTRLFACLFLVVYACAERLPLYIMYTPSHGLLFKQFFLPSVPEAFELRVHTIDQTCPSAVFKKEGWKDTTIQKVQMIIRAIEETWGSFFVYSDVDVQFFDLQAEELIALLEGYDLVIQKENPQGKVCSGFFICRSNERTRALWHNVLRAMNEFEKYSDQGALNYCLFKCAAKHSVQWNYLPAGYFGGGTFTGHGWCPGDTLPIPTNVRMHHANCTKGIEHKVAQLAYVKARVQMIRQYNNERCRKQS